MGGCPPHPLHKQSPHNFPSWKLPAPQPPPNVPVPSCSKPFTASPPCRTTLYLIGFFLPHSLAIFLSVLQPLGFISSLHASPIKPKRRGSDL
eukprot:764746-Hanusia_phi.AAC.6